MSCPICFCKPMNCDCTQEAKQLYYLRQEMSESQDEQLSAKQAERRELFKQVAVLSFDKLSFEWEGSQSVGLSHQCYKFIATCAEAILKAADEFSKKDSHE